jgi:hypothetical protein
LLVDLTVVDFLLEAVVHYEAVDKARLLLTVPARNKEIVMLLYYCGVATFLSKYFDCEDTILLCSNLCSLFCVKHCLITSIQVPA